MNLTFFGGTGRTGQYIVKAALAQGHSVTVLARSPEKMGLQDSRLTILAGDIKDAERIRQVTKGADAVISALGPTSNQPEWVVSQGMSNILAAMQSQGVRRIVVTAGAGVGDAQDAPKLINHVINFLLKVSAPNVLADMTEVVRMVRASDRDWTVVRLPMLTDDSKKGTLKVGYVGKGPGARITRADAAEFILAQIQDTTYLRQSPMISN